jgi:hypothetical protein
MVRRSFGYGQQARTSEWRHRKLADQLGLTVDALWSERTQPPSIRSARLRRRHRRTVAERLTMPCPWCLTKVDLMNADQLRQTIAQTPGQRTHTIMDSVDAAWPAWWCPRCHNGGLLIDLDPPASGTPEVRR